MNDDEVRKRLLTKKVKVITYLMSYKHSYNYINKNLFWRISDSSFEKSQRLITDHSIINATYNFINNAMNYLNITYPNSLSSFKITKKTPRQFLTYLLIRYHQKETIGVIKDDDTLGRNLIIKSKILHIAMNNIHRYSTSKTILNTFLYQLKMYIDAFEKWKNGDAELLVESLIQNYWELELVKKQDFSCQEDKGESVITMMKFQQEKLLKYIEEIGGDAGMAQFNSYIPIVFTENFMESVKDTLEVAYWDMYRNDLFKPIGERDITKLKSVMNELKTSISELVPKSREIQSSLLEFFDVDYICDMINNDSYTIDDLKNMLKYLINTLKSLDSPDNDIDNNNMLDELNLIFDELNERDLPIINKIGEGWINIFKNLIPKIKNIQRIKDFIMNEIGNDGDNGNDDDNGNDNDDDNDDTS